MDGTYWCKILTNTRVFACAELNLVSFMVSSFKKIFADPKLTLGQFPEGSYEDGACEIHHVESYEAFQKIQDSWEQ